MGRVTARRRSRSALASIATASLAVGALGVMGPCASASPQATVLAPHQAASPVARVDGARADGARVDGARVDGAGAKVASAEEAFSLDLLQRLGASAPNLVTSPSSLAILLAMLEPGAAGPTERGIATTLHSGDLSAVSQAAGWEALRSALVSDAGKKVSLDVANRAWLQDGLSVRSSYLHVLAADFGAGVAEQDMAHNPGAAAHAIDQWVAAHTAGHITNLITPAELNHVRAVLVDAVYLRALWEDPFNPSLTTPAPFRVAPGHQVQVPMMSSLAPFDVPVSTSTTLDVAQLPYKGGHFSALVLMPSLGQLGAFEAALTPQRLSAITDGLQAQNAAIELPKFSLNTSEQMAPVLTAMGMAQAFSNSADFSNLSPSPLKLAFVVQDAQIKVTPKGTEASAASAAGLMPTAVAAPPPLKVVFNHPFVFLVRDDSTGTIIFEAQVTNPNLA